MEKKAIAKSLAQTVRGTLKRFEGDYLEFHPYGKGEPAQTNVVKLGKSKMYDTTGRKPQRVAYLMVDRDCPDVRAEMLRQVQELTKAEKSERPCLPAGEEVVVLAKGSTYRLAVDEKRREMLLLQTLPLSRGSNYVGRLIEGVNRSAMSLVENSDKIRELEQLAANEQKREEVKA